MRLVKKAVAAALALILLMSAIPAWAIEIDEVLILPNDLKRIESGAFSDIKASVVRFPDGIEYIADDAFGTAVKSWQGSFNNPVARKWCKDHGWIWEPVRCYALIIGNSAYESLVNLDAIPNDLIAINNALNHLRGNWQITQKENLTGRQMSEAIRTGFTGATDADLSLFYYSGHGNETDSESAGSLIGVDSYGMTPLQLRNRLYEATPGPVCVLIDACGSGASVYAQEAGSADMSAGDQPDRDPVYFTRAIVNAFRSRSPFKDVKTGELRDTDKFSVLTACAHKETSMGSYLTEELVRSNIQRLKEDPSAYNADDFLLSLQGSAFTFSLVQSMGMHYPDCDPAPALSGDSNQDGMLTVSEAYVKVFSTLNSMDSLWREFLDYIRDNKIKSDAELTGPNHTIEELYNLHKQTAQFSGTPSNVLFWLPNP